MSLTAADLVARARSRIRETPVAQLQPRLSAAAVIDVREPAEFATGHLPGAVNIPRGMLEFEVAAHPAVSNVTAPALADHARHIVLYCKSGGRAALAAQALTEMGYTNVESIRGGVQAWIDAGLPLTT